MAVDIINRPNIGSSGLIEIIDGFEFEGFGSGGFGDDDFLYIGDALDNFIQAGPGNDELEGNDGNDELLGGDGNDIIDGDSGNDILDGQGGTDKLFGGLGDDILLAGGSGDNPQLNRDQLQGDPRNLDGSVIGGEPGNDIFGFYDLGFYRVNDFVPGEDLLFFDAEKTGIDNIGTLVGLISDIDQRDDGVTVHFGSNAAWIDLVGVNINDITADMVIFGL